MTDYITAQ